MNSEFDVSKNELGVLNRRGHILFYVNTVAYSRFKHFSLSLLFTVIDQICITMLKQSSLTTCIAFSFFRLPLTESGESYTELEPIIDALCLANLMGDGIPHGECQMFYGKAPVNLVFM